MAPPYLCRTLSDVQRVADEVARLLPQPERSLPGLVELLMNAVEHGNLGVGCAEKRVLLAQGRLFDVLEQRLQLAPYKDRVARVHLTRHATATRVTIDDEGDGFDFAQVLAATPRHDQPTGRGIFLARTLSFDRLTYEHGGRRAIAEVDSP